MMFFGTKPLTELQLIDVTCKMGFPSMYPSPALPKGCCERTSTRGNHSHCFSWPHETPVLCYRAGAFLRTWHCRPRDPGATLAPGHPYLAIHQNVEPDPKHLVERPLVRPAFFVVFGISVRLDGER